MPHLLPAVMVQSVFEQRALCLDNPNWKQTVTNTQTPSYVSPLFPLPAARSHQAITAAAHCHTEKHPGGPQW